MILKGRSFNVPKTALGGALFPFVFHLCAFGATAGMAIMIATSIPIKTSALIFIILFLMLSSS
jgi:hypothetical protein